MFLVLACASLCFCVLLFVSVYAACKRIKPQNKKATQNNKYKISGENSKICPLKRILNYYNKGETLH